MSAYATKPSTAFITKTKLKKTPASETSRAIRRFVNAHDFAITVDDSNHLKCAITSKDMSS